VEEVLGFVRMISLNTMVWCPSSNSSFSTAIASLDALSSSTFQLLLLEDAQASQWSKRVVEEVALVLLMEDEVVEEEFVQPLDRCSLFLNSFTGLARLTEQP